MLKLIKNEQFESITKPESMCIRVVVREANLTRIHAVYCSLDFFKWFYGELIEAKNNGSKIIAVVPSSSNHDPSCNHVMIEELIKKAA